MLYYPMLTGSLPILFYPSTNYLINCLVDKQSFRLLVTPIILQTRHSFPNSPIRMLSTSMDSSTLLNSFIFYFSSTLAVLRHLIACSLTIARVNIFFTIFDTIISSYYRFCGLSPFTVDLDEATTVHFWISSHRRYQKPNLVMIHGYGGDARWQFYNQVGTLSEKFNLYVPDLVFFGKSYSDRSDRTDVFQASCVVQGLKRLGVDRFSLYSISYGGYVAYRMAEMCPEELEKMVIVSTGVGCSKDQQEELIGKIQRDPRELLLPRNPQDLRVLVKLTTYKDIHLKWVPDFVLSDFVDAMNSKHRMQKLELVEHLLSKSSDGDLPALSQEILLIWGDKDNVFPVNLAYQLQSHLGPKSRLEIIKDTGHAANMESPDALNRLIISFVLGLSSHS